MPMFRFQIHSTGTDWGNGFGLCTDRTNEGEWEQVSD